jgi:hypothetical protein
MQTKGVGGGSDPVVVKADNDFVGYEIDYYSVNAHKEGVIVRFSLAELERTEENQTKCSPWFRCSICRKTSTTSDCSFLLG